LLKVQYFNELDIEINQETQIGIINWLDHSFHYENEINGEESQLDKITKLSKGKRAMLLVNLNTNLYGKLSKSVIIFDRGCLVGIRDENASIIEKVYTAYDTRFGRVGILIGTDIYDRELIYALGALECDIIYVAINDSMVADFMAEKFDCVVLVVTESTYFWINENLLESGTI